MEIKTLYRYQREGGGITISPNKPDCEYTEKLRLIAGDGKMLTKDGEDLRHVVDVDSSDGWYEVDAPEETEEVEG